MAVHIIRREPPRIPPDALAGVPDAASIFALLALLHSPDGEQRYRARRLLRMHVQVMNAAPADRTQAIAYIEQELNTYPDTHPKPEGAA